jgi:thioester reductase-like protein
LESRKLTEVSTSPKIVALSSDLSKPDLGLGSSTFAELQSEVTYIFHCAWAVNFALSVQSFVPQLASLQNLINLSLSSPFSRPAKLLFCSSVGTAIACPFTAGQPNVRIEETPIPDLTWASPTGYARSKLIAERMVEEAVASAGADAVILRIGQIIPARSTGSQLWNPNEMIPLMVRSATTIGALPDALGGGDFCSWIDVDTIATAVIEIGEQKSESQLVYNLVCPRPSSWKLDFLPALQAAGLKFDMTDRKSWLQKLRESEPDAEKNPSRKLLAFWEVSMLKEDRGEIVFATNKAEENVRAIREMVRLISGDYVRRLVNAWRLVW